MGSLSNFLHGLPESDADVPRDGDPDELSEVSRRALTTGGSERAGAADRDGTAEPDSRTAPGGEPDTRERQLFNA